LKFTRRLFAIFDSRGKIQLVLLFLILLLGVILEIIGIGSILPFITIIIDPNTLEKYHQLKFLYIYLGFDNYNQFILFACILLIFIFIIKNISLFLIRYIQISFINNNKVILSRRLLLAYLSKDYSFHLQRNTADLLGNIVNGLEMVLTGVIFNFFMILTEILVTGSIVIVLFIVDPFSALTVSIFSVGSLLVFFKLIKQKIDVYGKIRPKLYGEIIKSVNQGLGGIKETKVLGREKFFLDDFNEKNVRYARSELFSRLMTFVPRYLFEIIVVAAMLIIIVINIIRGNDLNIIMPTLGIFAVAAFRILPSLNSFFALLTSIKINLPYFDLIYDDIMEAKSLTANEELIDTSNMIINKGGFEKSIEIKDVSFRYQGNKNLILKDINIEILKGQAVGFVGTTGAGKTTLVDIILGLLDPERGQVLVDGKDIRENYRNWQQQIGYIPQFIYLSDDTVRRNVAFGLSDEIIDDDQIWKSLEIAQLNTFIQELPQDLDSIIGERGICLSGGQRQRIGIARALYHNPSVLIMDEATSSLDNETEKFFIEAIEKMSREKTILIIAHRLTTIEKCDVVFAIENGKATKTANS
jgi:ABC-type multidrug transport system fused ATPase/permease subunit